MEPKLVTDIYIEEYGAVPVSIPVSTIDANVPISSGGNLQLRMWVADNSKPIRGVLVGCHYLGGNWLNFVTRTAWQTLGQSHGFAVIGLYFNNSGNDPNANGGTQALIDGIDALASNSGHFELKNAPICIYGFSAGGGFSVFFTQYAPTRTISFAHNKGQSLAGARFTGAALTVPGFVIYGSNDTTRIADIKNTFSINRNNHAQWALLVDWDRAHEEAGNAEPMALEYFNQLIESRLPTGYIPGNNYTLVAFDENSGWLGDNNTYDPGPAIVVQHSVYTGSIYSASWIPNQYLANQWCNVVSRSGTCSQQQTYYRCYGNSCIPDVNGTYTSCNPNPCTIQGYNCSNCNTPVYGGIYSNPITCQTACGTSTHLGCNGTTQQCESVIGGGGNTDGCTSVGQICTTSSQSWFDRTTCITSTFCISNKYMVMAIGTGTLLLILMKK